MKTTLEQISEQFVEIEKIADNSSQLADQLLRERDEARWALIYCQSTLRSVAFALGENDIHAALNQIAACMDKINERLGDKP